MNSIVENLTKDNVISEIYLLLHHPDSSKMYVIVEGVSDIKLLNKLFMNSTIIQSYGGRNGVFEIVNRLNNNRVIGICDRDYNYIANNRVFYYESHSLETMLFMNEKVFSSVIKEYKFRNNEVLQFRQNVVEIVKPVSILRDICTRNGWHVRIEPIKPDSYLHNNHFSASKLFAKIQQINGSFDITSLETVDFQNSSFPDDKLHGHTLMWAISYLLPFSISVDTVDSLFRCSYNMSDFKLTDLFRYIKNHLDMIGVDSKHILME